MEFTLKTEQRQTLSQNMIQSSAILQMASSHLEQYLTEQALENPVLELTSRQPEEPDSKVLETYQWISSHDEQNRYLYSHLDSDDEDPADWNIPQTRPESLSGYLWEQLLTRTWPPAWEPALHYLLDSLDSKGYYTDSLDDLAALFHLTNEEAADILALVQSLDPAGIGARSLEECLCLQLSRQNLLTPALQTFISDNLPLIAKNQLAAISRNSHLSMAAVKTWCTLIRGLNPKPGAPFSNPDGTTYITPDIIVLQTGSRPEIRLNDSTVPEITPNGEYLSMFQDTSDTEVHEYLLQKIKQVHWLNQCVRQRNTTLTNVAQAILMMQQEFFCCGPDALKPLNQSDVADYLGLHVSTVSRACSQKYLQCTYGTFPLSYFFPKSAARHVPQSKSESAPDSAPDKTAPAPFSCDAPNASTSLDVKKALAAIIQQENTAKPYSDRVLAELLTNQGYSISRRTVTKYREELSIPGTTGRKAY